MKKEVGSLPISRTVHDLRRNSFVLVVLKDGQMPMVTPPSPPSYKGLVLDTQTRQTVRECICHDNDTHCSQPNQQTEKLPLFFTETRPLSV